MNMSHEPFALLLQPLLQVPTSLWVAMQNDDKFIQIHAWVQGKSCHL